MSGPAETLRVTLPVDIDAEQCAAGIAIDSCRGAMLVRSRTEREDFYDVRLWRIVEAAASCPNLFACTEDSERRLERIHAAAAEMPTTVEVSPAELATWIGRRSFPPVSSSRLRTDFSDPRLWHNLRKLSERPRLSLTDEAGHYPRRLHAAADARRRVLALVAELEVSAA